MKTSKISNSISSIYNDKIIIFVIVGLLLLTLSVYIVKYARKKVNTCNNESFDNEAIANIASLYNTSNMTITNLNVTGKLNILPKGIITAWTGTTAPVGWAICNGSNGTPDLRGRFIYGYGAGSGSKMNGSGGAETHRLAVNEMPSHSHRIFLLGDDEGYCKKTDTDCHVNGSGKRTNDNSGPDINSIESTGGNQPHNNMPPYYVLAFIMKL